METINTVTISIDEYFELRNKSQMNDYLLREFGEIHGRMQAFEQRLFEFRDEIYELKKGNK